MPDILENRCPRCDADARADENRNFILKNIFCRGAVRPINADLWHLFAMGKGNLVHSHWVEFVVEFCLRFTGSEGVGQCAGEVADLSDVDRYIRVERTGCDGERVPLVSRDGRAIEEEPLAGFVFHGGFDELYLYRVCWFVSDPKCHGKLGKTLPKGCLTTLTISVDRLARISR